MEIKQAIARLAEGADLTADQIAGVFGLIMDGQATAAQIGALLMGLRAKGETAEEIAGAARAMRDAATPCACPDIDHAVDTCGTGGDGSGHVNISTMAAVVVAAAGVRVAKHGNRALSSKSGSADVLESLGVNVSPGIEVVERCLAETNIAFLFAPSFHAATRHAAGPRRELGTRTIFNLLGPITNPAGVRNQLVGVFDGAWCEPVARALGQLGSRRAFVVHGAGGIDEIATKGETLVAEWNEDVGDVTIRHISPADFGLDEVDPAGLAGADAEFNASVARRLFAGERVGGERVGADLAAVRTAVVMEVAVALTAAGAVDGFEAGAVRAGEVLDSGGAADTLDQWVKLSNDAAG